MRKRIYYVYVIQALQPSGESVYYVGQSGLRPLERLRQHVRGARYCGRCTRRSYVPGPRGTRLRLRMDLVRPVGRRWFTRERAEAAERKVAARLRRMGYTVRGGH